MPESTVRAIVLKRTDSGESDRRLTVLTHEQGKIDVIAKGARKSGSRLAGVSDPLAFAELQIASGRHRSFVTQAQPITSLPGLREDYDRLLCGLAIAELADAFLPYNAPAPEVFDAVADALVSTAQASDPCVGLAWFGAWLLDHDGQMPDWRVCAATGAAIKMNPVWVSPLAGGAVCGAEAETRPDCLRVSAEALIGISKSAELPVPPQTLKRSVECALVMHLMWTHKLERELPAFEASVRSFRA
ncbi:MAG TPA: DNA repair protein RecO [Fimbriimonadaceae bacterium]|nr:DNA repair protein RecO [Fimbriimonadaceae bacterium]